MGWRQNQLAHYGDQLVWLDHAAAEAYAAAMRYCSRNHYELKLTNVESVERIDVNATNDYAAGWLSRRMGSGRVRIVFGKTEVSLTEAVFFVSNWQDMLCPSRDDAMIVPELGKWVLFYCHEDEFEYGIRRPA